MNILPNTQENAIQTRNMAMLSNAHAMKKRTKLTALETRLSAERLTWVTQYAIKRQQSYYAALSGWRTKLQRYSLQSESCYEYRRTEANRNEGAKSIFEHQNDSLNLVAALSEFFIAQATNDLFGSTPWLAAKPQGRKDATLGDQVTKHVQWKLGQSNIEDALREAVKLTSDLGTCFTLTSWKVKEDHFEEPRTMLHYKSSRKPVTTSNGDGLYDDDVIEEEPLEDGTGVKRYPAKDKTTSIEGETEWLTGYKKDTRVVYENIEANNLHFGDVAFDPTAKALDLEHTDFFHTFTKSLADVVKDYGLNRDEAYRLYMSAKERTEAHKAQDGRAETEPELEPWAETSNNIPNIPVRMVQGFMRFDVIGRKQPCNIYALFCPELDWMIKVDYLANRTPKGLLPVHVHTIDKIPHRIVGRGFFEKYERDNTTVDDFYNRINWHDRKSSVPITGYDKSKLELEDEQDDKVFSAENPLELKPDQKLDEAIQFKAMPDLADRTLTMMNLHTQMMQLRSGITSASQGDMTGLPETNTATGVKQLMSRAAALLKTPIDGLKKSSKGQVNYSAKVLYANFNRDEAFVWGEGENAELINLTVDQVQNLEVDIELLMTQSQNAYKLENAKAAIEIVTSWISVPEVEKPAVRELYVQALRALDFANADAIIRKAVVTLNDWLTMLPPELAQQVMAAFAALQAQQQPTQANFAPGQEKNSSLDVKAA